MKDGGKSVKINTTSEITESGIGGISDTLLAYEQWDMNMLNDPAGKHPEYNGPTNLGGKK